MKILDQGYFHPKVEVPRLTCLCWESNLHDGRRSSPGEHSSKELFEQRIKGTVLRDRFRKCCQKLTDLGLNKGRGWFLNFSEAPLIFC
jgi:hypothetical protein